ncbi:hypothetical protein LXN10_01785 [Arcobacter sp. KX21116]|uniref:hypothetical protein n=1 Tax=Arcobacter iocasae TaxID=2906515 RepID=UPI0035D51FAA
MKTLKNTGITEFEYKEMIQKTKISEKKLNWIYQELDKNVKQIINGLNIKFIKELKIDFINPKNIRKEDKNIENACVIKVDINHYKIVIFPKLIDELFRHAHFVMSYSKIFKSLDRNHKDINVLTESILLYWLDFIFFHEYAHIIWGHLDFKVNENYQINEINNNNEFSDDEIEIIRVLEAEADYYGSRFAFGRYNLSKTNLYEYFNAKCDEYEMIEDYILSINFLFEWFADKCKEVNETRLHPLPYERLSVILEGIMSTPDNNIKHLNKFEFQLTCMRASIHHKDSLAMSVDDYLVLVKKGADFIQHANKIKENYIIPYRKIYGINKDSSFSEKSEELFKNEELINKCQRFIKEPTKEKEFFGFLTIDSLTLTGNSKKFRNIKLKKLINIIYEDMFNCVGKMSLVYQFLPYGHLLMFLILIKDGSKLNNKINLEKTININPEQGLCLLALYHLTYRINDESKGVDIQLLEKCCNKLYKTKGFKVNNLEEILEELEEIGCIEKEQNLWYLKEEMKIV